MAKCNFQITGGPIFVLKWVQQTEGNIFVRYKSLQNSKLVFHFLSTPAHTGWKVKTNMEGNYTSTDMYKLNSRCADIFSFTV